MSPSDDRRTEAELERPRGQRVAAVVVAILLAAAALAAWLASS
jgi:hypothetical protein